MWRHLGVIKRATKSSRDRSVPDGLNPEQINFVNDFRSGKFNEMMIAGSAGSGKTFICLGLLHILCCNISGLKFAVIRKSEKNLKQTSIPSYNKMKRLTKSVNDSKIIDMAARYKNGSEILFVWADISKDPDLDNVKGLEIDGALIEEANQIDIKYRNILKTRIGRWSNKIKPFLLLNCNPSANWVKEEYYDPWENDILPEGRYFKQLSTIDNRHLSREYLDNLETLPEEEYARYVQNVWNYIDNPHQLIKYEWYKQCVIDQYEELKTARNLLACDVARFGDDKTIIGRMSDNHMGWWEDYSKQDTVVTAGLLKIRRKEFNVHPKDVIVDAIGVGAGTVDACNHGEDSFLPFQFLAGIPSTKVYNIFRFYNLRSQVAWEFRESLKNEEITVQHHPQLQKDCLAVEYDSDDKTLRVAAKKDIKKKLGFSPDYLDTAGMLNWRFKNSHKNNMHNMLTQQINKNESSLRGSSRARRERREARRRSAIG
jgi:phage terminase large subunit